MSTLHFSTISGKGTCFDKKDKRSKVYNEESTTKGTVDRVYEKESNMKGI